MIITVQNAELPKWRWLKECFLQAIPACMLKLKDNNPSCSKKYSLSHKQILAKKLFDFNKK
jgi:hypothetical protein